jgi:hypothetical protein
MLMRNVGRLVRFALQGALVGLAVAAPAWAADIYSPRPEVRTSARVPLALRTLSYHSAAVLAAGPCWRGCTAHCGWHFQRCLRVAWLDGCLAHNNACELACLRQCRLAGGPLVTAPGW